MNTTDAPELGAQELTYEPVPEVWNEPLTDTHIEVSSRDADLADFLQAERDRENQRRRWVNMLMQQKTQNEVHHKQALAEQEQLHQHSQAKIDDQLALLGYESPKTLEVLLDSAPHPAIVQPTKKRGRPFGSGKKAAAATPPTPKASAAPVPKKRVVSEETKRKMKLSAAKRWAKRAKA